MKAGILTFHNNENKGAILQGWCLAKIIQELTSCYRVDIIDYRTRSKEISRIRPFLITKKLKRAPMRFKDWRICQHFIKNNLPLSEESIVTNNFSKAESKLESLKYDLLIIGSDEVWKVHKPGAGTPVISPKRPFPNLYFPSPRLSATKISYAASANTLEYNQLTESQKAHIRASLQDFDLISVRDRHTKRVLNKFGFEDVHQVADPTILQEIPSPDVTTLLQNNGIDPNSPIIGIHGLPDNQFATVCEWYRDRGYQIVSPMMSPHADVNLKSKVNPFEYYSLYEHFDMVLTNSLHSTIFSLKNHTPFITVDTASVYRHTQSKTKSLLQDLNLLNRHYDAVNGETEDLLDRVRQCETPLDEETVDRSISKLIQKSEKYLQKVAYKQ